MVWVLQDLDPRGTALAMLRSNCTVNYRSIFSSEEVHNVKKPSIVRQKTTFWPWVPDESPTPRQIGQLTVGRNLSSTSTSTSTNSYRTSCYIMLYFSILLYCLLLDMCTQIQSSVQLFMLFLVQCLLFWRIWQKSAWTWSCTVYI
jgi:hypothetical protein